MNLYKFVKNNEDAFEEELYCRQSRLNILKHYKLKNTKLADVFVDHIKTQHNKDFIYFVRATMFTTSEDIWPPEKFEFYYIPFIYKDVTRKVDKKYYILIKDSKSFFKTDIENFALDVKNYENLFIVAQTTWTHPHIEDIVVTNYIINREIQYGESMKIVSNMMFNLNTFVEKLIVSENEKFLRTEHFEDYRHKTVVLLKQIIENDKLKYGVDYKLPIFDLCVIFLHTIKYIPKYSIPENYKYPIAKYSIRKCLNSEETETFCFMSPPTQFGLRFSYSLPGKEWEKFYEGIRIYKELPNSENKDENGESKRYVEYKDRECSSCLKEYLDSISEYQDDVNAVKKEIPYEKRYNPSRDIFTIISTTNSVTLESDKFDDIEDPKSSFELPSYNYTFVHRE